MKKGAQKKKGNAHERAIAKLFTEAYYPDGDGEFRRVPISGAWDKRAAPGDLIAFKYISKDPEEMIIDKSFPFLVECKNWKDENVKHFVSGLYSEETQMWDWMNQAIDDAEYTRQKPLVVFKLYRAKNIAMLKAVDFNEIQEVFGNYMYDYYMLKRWSLDLSERTPALVFCLLSSFIGWIDWHVYKLRDKVKFLREITEKK